MQKRDLFHHSRNWDGWLEQLTPNYIEEGLIKENSVLFVNYFKHLGRTKSKGYAYRNLTKIRSIFVGLQNKGIKDISKTKTKEIEDYFFEWTKDHSNDYVKRWNAFWSWWKKVNRKEGIIIQDLNLDLKDFKKEGSGESDFVWLKKEEFDNFRKYFEEDEQTILLFSFDTIIRCPTELLSLRRENIYTKGEEVWVDIPKQISKTIGRKFNLVYSGDAILKYIKKYDIKPEDYLFNLSSPLFNKAMQKVAKQIFGEKKSEGGEYFKNITMYDLRHSGSVHFRQLFQKTGQSLDLLRERGGWSNFDMIDYYTKRLGLTGHISKEKLLLEEDKTKIENEIENIKEKMRKWEKVMVANALGHNKDPKEQEKTKKIIKEVLKSS